MPRKTYADHLRHDPDKVAREKDWLVFNKEYPPIDVIPAGWRDVHKKAFDPEMIHIGPLKRPDESHHGLKVMEVHKVRFLDRLLGGELDQWRREGNIYTSARGERRRVECEREEDEDGGGVETEDGGGVETDPRLIDFLEAMYELQPKIQGCYPKDSHFYPEKQVVLDGCFVVELLRLYYDLLQKKSPAAAIQEDQILTNPQILTSLRRDLLLLENQLPFFALEKLYELINKKNKIDHRQAVSLEELAVTFFDPLLHQHNVTSKLDTQNPKDHLLDVFRSTFLKSVNEKVHKKGKNRVKSQLNPGVSSRGSVLHFASELQEAGVQFRKWKDHDLLDIEFSHRTLRVPPLSLNGYTISLLLNFAGYELSVNHPEPFFTNYLMFWNSLVNSPRDIQILGNHGIINNMGSEKAVAELLMRCRDVISALDLGYLHNEIKDVNDYCERYHDSKYLVWWISLIRERFSSPWTCLSLFAAIILLLLTLLQTFYTVYAYYRPH